MADCIGHILIYPFRCRDRSRFEEFLDQYRFFTGPAPQSLEQGWEVREHWSQPHYSLASAFEMVAPRALPEERQLQKAYWGRLPDDEHTFFDERWDALVADGVFFENDDGTITIDGHRVDPSSLYDWARVDPGEFATGFGRHMEDGEVTAVVAIGHEKIASFLAEELVIASDGRWAFTEHQPMRSAFKQRLAAKYGG